MSVARLQSINLKTNKLCMLCKENNWNLFPVDDILEHIRTVYDVQIRHDENDRICSTCWFHIKLLAVYKRHSAAPRTNVCVCSDIIHCSMNDKMSRSKKYFEEVKTKYASTIKNNLNITTKRGRGAPKKWSFENSNLQLPTAAKNDKKMFNCRVRLINVTNKIHNSHDEVRMSKRLKKSYEQIIVVSDQNGYSPKSILFSPKEQNIARLRVTSNAKKRVSWSNTNIYIDTDEEFSSKKPKRKKIKIEDEAHPKKLSPLSSDKLAGSSPKERTSPRKSKFDIDKMSRRKWLDGDNNNSSNDSSPESSRDSSGKKVVYKFKLPTVKSVKRKLDMSDSRLNNSPVSPKKIKEKESPRTSFKNPQLIKKLNHKLLRQQYGNHYFKLRVRLTTIKNFTEVDNIIPKSVKMTPTIVLDRITQILTNNSLSTTNETVEEDTNICDVATMENKSPNSATPTQTEVSNKTILNRNRRKSIESEIDNNENGIDNSSNSIDTDSHNTTEILVNDNSDNGVAHTNIDVSENVDNSDDSDKITRNDPLENVDDIKDTYEVNNSQSLDKNESLEKHECLEKTKIDDKLENTSKSQSNEKSIDAADGYRTPTMLDSDDSIVPETPGNQNKTNSIVFPGLEKVHISDSEKLPDSKNILDTVEASIETATENILVSVDTETYCIETNSNIIDVRLSENANSTYLDSSSDDDCVEVVNLQSRKTRNSIIKRSSISNTILDKCENQYKNNEVVSSSDDECVETIDVNTRKSSKSTPEKNQNTYEIDSSSDIECVEVEDKRNKNSDACSQNYKDSDNFSGNCRDESTSMPAKTNNNSTTAEKVDSNSLHRSHTPNQSPHDTISTDNSESQLSQKKDQQTNDTSAVLTPEINGNKNLNDFDNILNESNRSSDEKTNSNSMLSAADELEAILNSIEIDKGTTNSPINSDSSEIFDRNVSLVISPGSTQGSGTNASTNHDDALLGADILSKCQTDSQASSENDIDGIKLALMEDMDSTLM